MFGKTSPPPVRAPGIHAAGADACVVFVILIEPTTEVV